MAKSKVKAKVAKVAERKDVADVNTIDETKAEELKAEEPKADVEESNVAEVTEEDLEKAMKVLGKVKSPVYQKSSFIKTKAYNSPVCLYELPEDIRTYLTNKGWGTNVYEKGEEWLERHRADMKMIEKLKKFISEHYL